MHLQAVGAHYSRDRVLFVERANELRYVARLSTSGVKPKRKRVLIGRLSHMT